MFRYMFRRTKNTTSVHAKKQVNGGPDCDGVEMVLCVRHWLVSRLSSPRGAERNPIFCGIRPGKCGKSLGARFFAYKPRASQCACTLSVMVHSALPISPSQERERNHWM